MEDDNNIERQLQLDFTVNNKAENKEDKIKKERQELLNKVGSGNITNTRERVAFILNNFNEARNSDLELAWLLFLVQKIPGCDY